MADEHESDIAAWLDDPATQRELAILEKRKPSWRESDRYLFVAMMGIFIGLDFYGKTEDVVDEDEEPWRPDSTGTP